MSQGPGAALEVGARVHFTALPGIPLVQAGDALAPMVQAALARVELSLDPGDVLVVTSKLFSRSEGRFVDMSQVVPSDEARALGLELEKDPAQVELILRESVGISRKRPGVLVTRHRLGFISANAAIDMSNASPANAAPGSGPWALLLPEDPDASARRLLAELGTEGVGLVVSDSFGRPFRVGTVGVAVGVAGIPAVFDQRGRHDLHGRELQYTITALADQLAAAADLVAGQSNEARPVVHIRGLRFTPSDSSTQELLRDPEVDLYA
ncbi:MAG: coenzyme F420-0:L-glutamate ligase [Sandaracinaceae bacterium]|nr:coenzyme F420-0:L-glutamate ligase [Sandaracinaceae bacterium]MBK8591651.1 coenzyme F420-0:L-glutamate ligase [Sandaracinaceae bacterium]